MKTIIVNLVYNWHRHRLHRIATYPAKSAEKKTFFLWIFIKNWRNEELFKIICQIVCKIKISTFSLLICILSSDFVRKIFGGYFFSSRRSRRPILFFYFRVSPMLMTFIHKEINELKFFGQQPREEVLSQKNHFVRKKNILSKL